MSRNKKTRKGEIRALAKKLGKGNRGAANVLARNKAAHEIITPIELQAVDYQGHIYAPEQIVQATRALIAKRPESHIFTAEVNSLKADGSDLVGPNGEVAEIDLVEVTFKEHRTDWYFDGAIAFIDGELWDGPTRVDASFLKTDEGKARLTKSILGSFDRWFVEQLRFFEVKRGFQNGTNLVVVVTLAIKDDQERDFIARSLALQKANTLASIEMSKGALNVDDATGPKRAAIAAAREALEQVKAAAVRDRQVALVKRAEGHEKTWRLWEESLDRIESRKTLRKRIAASNPSRSAADAMASIVDRMTSFSKAMRPPGGAMRGADAMLGATRSLTAAVEASRPRSALEAVRAIDTLGAARLADPLAAARSVMEPFQKLNKMVLPLEIPKTAAEKVLEQMESISSIGRLHTEGLGVKTEDLLTKIDKHISPFEKVGAIADSVGKLGGLGAFEKIGRNGLLEKIDTRTVGEMGLLKKVGEVHPELFEDKDEDDGREE